MKNKLIVFEGIDGVGKSSLARALVEYLRNHKIAAVCYEDTENKQEGYNLIKPFIKKNATIDASLLFYLSSAIFKSRRITELLQHYFVICDRYIYSTLAYHKIRGAKNNLIINYQKLPILSPDYLFLITANEQMRIKRIKARKKIDLDDLKTKKRGNLVWKTEQEYKKYAPIIIDNSENNYNVALNQILKILAKKISN
jgi:dTMP kinase